MKPTSLSQASTVAGMGCCYALGAFTDNFYKQTAILLAASMQLSSMQSIATVLFSLPFIVFSAWAGWLADRMVKKYIVIAAKSMELLALVFGGLMLIRGEWAGILAVIFIMGAQATIFSPALNGSIPENFTAGEVPGVNALIKLASTAAILAGIALAGIFLDLGPSSLGGILPGVFGPDDSAPLLATPDGSPAPITFYGRAAASVFIIIIAFLGLLTAFTLRKKPAAAGEAGAAPFPVTGPLDSARHVLAARKDKPLFLALLAEAWFYGIAVLAVISVANLATGLGYSNTIASAISAALMIGIAAGSLIAGGYSAESWRWLLLPSATGMGSMLILTSFAPALPTSGINPQLCWIFACQTLCGLCGGIYLIPLASYIQVRPATHEKGRILGLSNFMSFSAMALFGAAFQIISLLPPALTFALYGAATLAVTWLFAHGRLRRLEGASLRQAAAGPLAWLLRAVLALRYTVRVSGLENILIAPDSRSLSGADASAGILFLPNHPALIDPVIIYSRLTGLKPRPLADERQMRGPLQSLAARIIHAVTIPDPQKDGRDASAGVMAGLENIVASLKRGDNILLYPSGRVYRCARESLGANSAVARILSEAPDTRVVLARTAGLWGSSFSHAAGASPKFSRLLLRGLLTVLANLIFFTPRRKVDIEFVEARDLPRDGDRMRLNGYLEEFYNVAERPALAVPRYFWRGSVPTPVTAEVRRSHVPDELYLPDGLRERVYALIREYAVLPADQPLSPERLLNNDIHLDSLALAALASALESEFGHPVPRMENLVTVGDCLLAAVGNLPDAGGEQTDVPAAWFGLDESVEGAGILSIPESAGNVVDAFLCLARQAPSRPLLADRSSLRTRRQVLTGVLALSRHFSRLPDQRLGIMLPAVPAAVLVWLAALLAGKEAVMLNWTAGQRNVAHCVALSGIRRVITSSALLDQLARTGNPVRDTDIEWLAVERLAAGLRLGDKIRAAAGAALHCLGLRPVRTKQVPDIAAVLFTSGSESNPKAVPLSHGNIMTNALDILTALRVERRDRVLAMLPPFHSFGLMVGLALPAVTGLAAAYHHNPTESAPLVSLVRDYRLTLTGVTPTFLDAMLNRAHGGDDLSSLRFAFTGAEKCPQRVYDAFTRCCPRASLCEGYGITECSPVVSVNRPGNIVPGSVGHPLAGVRTAVVIEEEDAQGHLIPSRRAQSGETGMLLLHGKSIFAGYLGEAPDPFVDFEGIRWYRSGDLVVQDADGRLTFKGRLKRFVKMGGEMISLPLMEDVLQNALKEHPGLPEDGKPFIAVEAKPGSEDAGAAEVVAFTVLDIDIQELNRILRNAGLGPVYAVRRVIHIAQIPLLGTGKTDYRALRALA